MKEASSKKRLNMAIGNVEKYEQDLMTCVHCGLCLNACPTYLETGSEADSPRGRIVLMRSVFEGTLSINDPGVAEHLDRCLGCLSCQTACPSSVPYGDLIEIAREQVNASQYRKKTTGAARKLLLETIVHPNLMSLAMKTASLVTKGNIPAIAANLISGDNGNHSINLPASTQINPALPPAVNSPIGERRARVALLTGCAMRVLFGDVNQHTVDILTANGCEVLVTRRQGCCGALNLHNRFLKEGLDQAKALIDVFTPFDGLDAIVVNSAGCGSTMKDYGRLLKNDKKYQEPAAQFAAKVKDISEFLDELGWVAPLNRLGEDDVVIAYHDACHLAHGQGIRSAPRNLLQRIPGVTLRSLDESDICCGSAGIYNFTEPDMARGLQRRKIDNILKTGASIVAASNPGCLSWIQNGINDQGINNLRLAHPVSLLAESINNL